MFRLISKTWNGKALLRQEIPAPKGSYPLLGHLLTLSGRFTDSVIKWHKELGPIFQLKIGTQNWIFLADPEAAHQVLVTKGKFTSERPRSTFFSEFISPKERLSDVYILECQKAVHGIYKQVKRHPELDPMPFAFLISFNMMTASIFGLPSIDSTSDPEFLTIKHTVFKAMDLCNPSKDFYAIFPYLSFLEIFLQRKPKMKAFVQNEFHPMIVRLIQCSRKSKRDSFVSKFDAIKDTYGLDELSLISLLSELIITGIHTTSLSLVWTFAILCRYPKMQKRMQEEIDCFIEKYGSQPRFEEKSKLPYLVAFIKECLRFRPPTEFSTPHKTSKDVIVHNYLIPKGSLVSVNIHTLHHDPQLYKEPEDFDPERFINDSRSLHAISHGPIDSRNHYAFGWGRRICPGIYLIEAQLFYIVFKVVSTFTIKPILLNSKKEAYPDLRNLIDNGITIEPKPFMVRFVPRNE
ncbi:cytochrome P450 [Sporodiniella umbellata]|nr:cytochrome P450 [Sporodiniella umbellata]